MENSTNLNTFLKLVKSHRIEIPIIQRDYAQGRSDPKIDQIRKSFVEFLLNAVATNQTIGLNFVYGKILGKVNPHKRRRDRDRIENLLSSVSQFSRSLNLDIDYKVAEGLQEADGISEGAFIPLDGQQRLTTLFLLHWYLSTIAGEYEPSLSNFSYQTRKSSRDFCKALVASRLKIDKGIKISEAIYDAHWFYSSWKSDPTVVSMLTVLDEIQRVQVEIGLKEELWRNLSSSDPITFEFLDMEKFELTDELYVKMNARGKGLSDFEDFKAWLQGFVKDKGFHFEFDWKKRMDIEWTDIFWHFRVKGVYEVDSEYFTIFKILFLGFHSEKVIVKNKLIDDRSKEIYDVLRNTDFFPIFFFEKNGLIDQHILNSTFSVLRAFEKGGWQIIEGILDRIPIFEKPNFIRNILGSENSKLNLPDRTFFYALTQFLIISNKRLIDYSIDEKRELFQWMRITRNLLYNTPIDSQPDFVTAILSIKALSLNCRSIYSFFSNENVDLQGISEDQIMEEMVKCKLILQNPDWEDAFIQFENHEYFYYQIGFLIDFSMENGSNNLASFISYGKKASLLYCSDLLGSLNFEVQRALLTKGDYLIKSGGINRSFCYPNNGTLRVREENWRRFFRNSEKVLILKDLLDDERTFSEILADPQPKDEDIGWAWRSYFVEYPAAILYCEQRLIRWEQEGNYIMLLGSSKMSGYHAELYSYCFYIKYLLEKEVKFHPFENVDYYNVKGRDDRPCAYLDQWSYRNLSFYIDISYSFELGKFELLFSNRENVKCPLKITAILESVGLKSIDGKISYLLYSTSEDRINSTLRKLCKSIGVVK